VKGVRERHLTSGLVGRWVRGLALGVGAAGPLALTGCSLGYYAQSVGGHLELLRSARPVSDWVADPATPAALKERLELAQRLRAFAVRELGLPDNASYQRFAALGRPAVVWNVVAAPALSLTLQTWCFPVMGCVGYRGYFDRAGADALAAELRAQGLEVSVYGVPAYSTLGWTNWLGGDPLLDTFIRWPEGELARLLFHELAHQVVYVADDTTFNESYATAVERLGAQRWLAQASPAATAARAEYAALDARRQDFRALVGAARRELEALYRSPLPEEAKRERKAQVMQALRKEYQRLKTGPWGGFAGYDGWFERANNAALGVQAAYDELVPGFERLFEAQGRDFARFHAEVSRLARLPREARRAQLLAEPLMPASPSPQAPGG
jgi:predicted aminopeptidase